MKILLLLGLAMLAGCASLLGGADYTLQSAKCGKAAVHTMRTFGKLEVVQNGDCSLTLKAEAVEQGQGLSVTDMTELAKALRGDK